MHREVAKHGAVSLLGGALKSLEEREELRHRAEEAEKRLAELAEAHKGPPERGALGLADRQLKLLGLMADGRSARQLASELGLSVHTIHSHQRNLYRALGVKSSANALQRANELGLYRPQGRAS